MLINQFKKKIFITITMGANRAIKTHVVSIYLEVTIKDSAFAEIIGVNNNG